MYSLGPLGRVQNTSGLRWKAVVRIAGRPTYGSVDFLRNAMHNSALKLQIVIGLHSTAVVTNRETISIIGIA